MKYRKRVISFFLAGILSLSVCAGSVTPAWATEGNLAGREKSREEVEVTASFLPGEDDQKKAISSLTAEGMTDQSEARELSETREKADSETAKDSDRKEEDSETAKDSDRKEVNSETTKDSGRSEDPAEDTDAKTKTSENSKVKGTGNPEIDGANQISDGNIQDKETSAEREKEEDPQVDRLQTLIDELPSMEAYEYMSLSKKKEVSLECGKLKQQYYEELTDDQRKQVDASRLFALDLYAETYAYHQSEAEYAGQLTLDDRDTVRISASQLEELQEDIDDLPDLAEITKVDSIETCGNYGNVDEEKSISYSDEDVEMYISSDETDELYEDVYEAAEVYYSLEDDQAALIDETELTSLVSFFSVGATVYAMDESPEATIDGYSMQRYSGNMSSSTLKFGYYTVTTGKSDGSATAFCMDSEKWAPGGVGTTFSSESEYTNKVVRTILYYGYGGPGELVNHTLNGYCETHMAICYAVDGKSIHNGFGAAAYKKLYTDVADKEVYQYVAAWKLTTGVSDTQPLVYARFSGGGQLKKVSATRSSRVVAGAKYKVYTDKACENPAKTITGGKCLLTTSETGSNTLMLAPGTYYVKETEAAEGYALDPTVHKMKIVKGKTTLLEVEDIPLAPLLVAKKGAQTNQVIAGAQYRVYSDPECSTKIKDANGKYTLTTTDDGAYSNTLYYPVGTTVYVKEYKEAPGTAKDETVYSVTLVEGKTNWANGSSKAKPGWVYDQEYVRIHLVKKDAETGEIVAGARYIAYTDFACTTRAKSVFNKYMGFTTTKDSSNNVHPTLLETIYLKESAAPEGYELSPDVYRLQTYENQYQVTRYAEDGTELWDSGMVNYEFEDGIRLVSISAFDSKEAHHPPRVGVLKISGNAELTEGNSAYSLEGAEYGIYESEEDARNGENCLAVLITDENGESDTFTAAYPEELTEEEQKEWSKTFYVRELKAPQGYLLNEEIYSRTVMDGETAYLICKDEPITEGFGMKLHKKDADTLLQASQAGTSLRGAIFALEFWANDQGDESGDPEGSWYFMTDEKGDIDFSDETYLVKEYFFSEDYGLGSSEVDEEIRKTYAGKTITSNEVVRDDGGQVVWKAGTYRLKEICPPALYSLEGFMAFGNADPAEGQKSAAVDGLQLIITYDQESGQPVYLGNGEVLEETDIVVEAFDYVHLSLLTVTKYGKSQRPLAGVTYRLTRLVDGMEYSAVTTDQTGEVSWDKLLPGDYILTEVSTVEGYDLLEENIPITLPCQMTEDELLETGADKTLAYYDAATGRYCFDKINYDITDSVEFEVPMTGGSDSSGFWMTVVAWILIALGIGLNHVKEEDMQW